MGLCRNFTVLGPAEIFFQSIFLNLKNLFFNLFFFLRSKLTLCSDRGLLKVARLCTFPYQLACNLSFSRKKIVVVVAVMELNGNPVLLTFCSGLERFDITLAP